jgi:tetratricopeptide (TPR) repeat protein
LQYYPESADLHNHLGLALASKRRLEEAKAQFEEALEINPNLAEAHHNLGRALAFTGQLEQAIPHFEKAIAIKPNFAEAHYNLGRALAAKGQLDEAMPHFEEAIAINPSFAEAHSDLGCALAMAEQYSQAIPHLEKALALKPDLVEAHYYLGESLYFSQARTQEALAHWRKALRLDPNFARAMNGAAHVLAAGPEASDRNGVEAVKLAERAVQVSGGRNPIYLDTLAAAYAEAGRFPDAIATARQALELATQQHRARLVEALNTRIKLYEARQPYRDTVEHAP